MKKIPQHLYSGMLLAGLFISILSCGCSGSKQAAVSDGSKEVITESINRGEWVFTANYVMPQSGRSRSTNGLYTVTYSTNVFVVYLPYFGKTYSASIESSQGPLDFKTSNFDIAKEQKKDGQWSLVINPKDYKEVQSMNFTLYNNGSADLNVTLTNRSPISFRGTVAPKK